jgi:hypothetical protein
VFLCTEKTTTCRHKNKGGFVENLGISVKALFDAEKQECVDV